MTIKIPTTIEEKIEVLKSAREKLDKGWTQSKWIEVIGDTHHYCLYGAIEAVMGVDFIEEANRIAKERAVDELYIDEWFDEILEDQDDYFREHDRAVNDCSLTESMFNAANPQNHWARIVRHIQDGKNLDDKMVGSYLTVGENLKQHGLKGLMSMSLQMLNDSTNQETVLKVIDDTIALLQAELAVS